jgi:succinate dehydrogenase / fumarate reductase cytochrome b subunit
MNVLTRSVASFWNSSIGKKFIVALTGIVLVLFLAGHLGGNLVVFMGPEPFNAYAYFLHHMVHGVGIWMFRGVMLVCLVLHVAATIQLTLQNRAARTQYECQATIQASKPSLTMVLTGLTILAFVVYHLLHFTTRSFFDASIYTIANAPHGEPNYDAWQMVVDQFHIWYITAAYVIAVSLLCSHLAHGVASIFQTLGLRTKKNSCLIDTVGLAYALVIWLGFISIPLAILIGLVGKH